jgi:NADH-quinone oxidoreductase subunit C
LDGPEVQTGEGAPGTSGPGAPEPPAVRALRAALPDAVRAVTESRGQWRVAVPRESLVAAVELLRDDPALDFRFLADLTAIDHYGTEPRFRMVYVLRCMARRDLVVLETAVPEEDCWAPTLALLFATANWLERECYDMFGVTFRGHPDLRRILMPEVFTDFPLRKEFPLQGRMSDQEWAEIVIARAQREEGEPR